MFIKSPEDIGKIIKDTRKTQGLTQVQLARLCGVGIRFVGDLENGKPTCQLDKTLIILKGLGIKIDMIPPYSFDGAGLGDGSGPGAGFGDGSGFGG